VKTLILGLGNPILCDDGVGFHIARALKGIFPHTEVHTTSMIDLQLLELMSDFERAFIVDAFLSNSDEIGTVKRLAPEQRSQHLFSSHGLNFFELLILGRELQYKLPEISGIYGIVIKEDYSFGTALSPEIMVKQEAIIQAIIEDIRSRG